MSTDSADPTSSHGIEDKKLPIKGRAYWNPVCELRLLRTVCKHNPFAAGHGNALKTWDKIADDGLNVEGGVTGEFCRAKTLK